LAYEAPKAGNDTIDVSPNSLEIRSQALGVAGDAD